MNVPEPAHDGSRVDRVWRAVEARLDDAPRRARRTRTLGVAATSFALAAGLLVVIAARHRPDPAPSVQQVTTPSAVVLADGSRIMPSKDAQYVLRTATAERVEIDLTAGEIDLDVTHVPARAFIVNAAGYEASVLGTRFRVRATPAAATALFVGVERGRVRVRGPNVDHVLGPGESWSADVAKTSAAATVMFEEGPVAIGPTTSASVAASRPGQPPSAKDLFQRALEARRAGRDREAASGFDQLRRTHRSDARAGLAAYELGRIRLDSLHDPTGAADAFADAIALAPSAPFREDAEARRVDALDAAGDRARCEEARAAYLARYPSGLHGSRLSQRCRAR